MLLGAPGLTARPAEVFANGHYFEVTVASLFQSVSSADRQVRVSNATDRPMSPEYYHVDFILRFPDEFHSPTSYIVPNCTKLLNLRALVHQTVCFDFDNQNQVGPNQFRTFLDTTPPPPPTAPHCRCCISHEAFKI